MRSKEKEGVGGGSSEAQDLCILFESLSLKREGEENYRMGVSEV